MIRLILSFLILMFCLISSALGAGTISDGLCLTYRSHAIQLLENYQDQKRQGVIFEYFDTGDVQKLFQYDNDKAHGSSVCYYSNQNVSYRLQFRQGFLHGSAQRYYANGQMAIDMRYRFGQPDGVVRFYTEKGALEKVAFYERGQFVRVRFCDPSGNIKMNVQ